MELYAILPSSLLSGTKVWVIVRNCTDNAKSKEAQKNSFGALNERGYYILLWWQGSDPPHWD